MNAFVLLMAFCAWALLFLQGLHMTDSTTAALWFFFAGVAQWVCGVTFRGAYQELKGYYGGKGHS